MAVRLLAIDSTEGKAFYEENGKFYHLRPLYGEGGIVPVKQEQMLLVVRRENYEKIDSEFANIKSAIEFIRTRYEENRRSSGLKIPEDSLLQKVIHNADDDILLEYIQKAIKIWLPENKLEEAKELLNDLKTLPNFQSRSKLHEATEQLKVEIEKIDTSVPVQQGPLNKGFFVGAQQLDIGYIIEWKSEFVCLYETYSGFNLFERVLIKRKQSRIPLMVAES
jgi:hypothetical protein